MTTGTRIGFLGGTFDPIHVGHLAAARAARAALALERVELVPARLPPHRQHQPAASSYHRFAMAALAINGVDGLRVSDVELAADGPSYTADTLTRLHGAGYTPSQIFFITGADAFAEIETWRRFPEVLDMAHFVVVARPGHALDDLPDRLPALAGRMTRGTVATVSGGPTVFLVEADTPDVSSTEIRRRVCLREPLTGLVGAAVEAHVVQHGLYGAARTGA
jgi:nicotinate-nucleotide adenylyltransferase